MGDRAQSPNAIGSTVPPFAAGGGGGAGATDPVLFKWNEIDVSEFTIRSDGFTGGLTMSVVTDSATGRPCIAFTIGANAGGAEFAWVTINTAELLQGLLALPLRYVFKCTVVGIGQAGSARGTMEGLIAVAMNELTDPNFNALGVTTDSSGNQRAAVYDTGAITENTNTENCAGPGTLIAAGDAFQHGMPYKAQFLFTVGTPGVPYMSQFSQSYNGSSCIGANAALSGGGANWGWISPLSAAWNTYTPTTAGFFMRGDTTTAPGPGTTGEVRIMDIEILRHPMDL